MLIQCKELVGGSQVGADGKLRFTAALDMVQDCECVGAYSEVKFWNWFETHNMAMFIVSRSARVLRIPEYRENLTVRTAPYLSRTSLGHRRTEILDASGKLCLECHTIAAYVDLDSGATARIPRELADEVELHPYEGTPAPPRRITVEGVRSAATPIAVRRADIDINRHMNNVGYIEAALELIPFEQPSAMRVEYKSAAKFGDLLCPEVYVSDSGVYCVDLTDGAGKTYALVEFAP